MIWYTSGMEEEVVQESAGAVEAISDRATQAAEAFQQSGFVDFVSQFDVLFFLIFAAGSALYFYTFGKERVITCTLAVYVSYVLISMIPYIAELPINIGQPDFVVRMGLFAVLTGVVSWLMFRNDYFGPYLTPEGAHLGLYSIGFIGLFTALALTFLPADVIEGLSPAAQLLFASNPWQSIWIAGPLLLSLAVQDNE